MMITTTLRRQRDVKIVSAGGRTVTEWKQRLRTDLMNRQEIMDDLRTLLELLVFLRACEASQPPSANSAVNGKDMINNLMLLNIVTDMILAYI